MSITAPGIFPARPRFNEYYAQPDREADTTLELLAQLRRRIRPLVQRRTKDQVAADLPPKQEQVLEVELDPRHRRIYQTHLQRERQKVLGLVDDLNKNRFAILRSLTLLRQLSLRPALVDAEHAHARRQQDRRLVEQLSDIVAGGSSRAGLQPVHRFPQPRPGPAGRGRHRVRLPRRPHPQPADVIDGSRTATAPVFLISLKAGGFGLNLTEADYCFVLDPWWNPATEAQAVDRAHRIGQTRNVMVYRLVAKDTIEEKVLALAGAEGASCSGVMDDGDGVRLPLSADDIRALLA